MKRLIINALASLIAIIATSVCSFAQVKQYSNDLSAFNTLEVSGSFEITMVYGAAYNVLFSVDEVLESYVICNISKQVLTIGIDEKRIPKEVKALYKGKNSIVPTYKATITVPVRPQKVTLSDKVVYYDNINELSASGFELSATDQASVKTLNVSAPSVKLDADKKATIAATICSDDATLYLKAGSNMSVTFKETKNVNASLWHSSNLVTYGDVETLAVDARGTSKAIMNGSAIAAAFDLQGSANVNAGNLPVEEATVTMNSLCSLVTNVGKTLDVQSLKGGATLNFAGEPEIKIGSIEKSTMTRTK